MALFVGMGSLALVRPKENNPLGCELKLVAAPREKIEYVFGWQSFPKGLIFYVSMAAASGIMIQWFALKPPGLLAFPVATANLYLLPLCFIFVYSLTMLLKIDRIWSCNYSSGSELETENSSMQVLAAVDPVPSVHAWQPNALFLQTSITFGIIVGSSHTVASNLYELSDKSSCESFSAERSSVTDFYWFARCLASILVGYTIDRIRHKVALSRYDELHTSIVYRHLSMIAGAMAMSAICTLIFRSTSGYCLGLPFLLVAAGLSGAVIGATMTILPLFVPYVFNEKSPLYFSETSFGFSLGLVSIGPVLGVIIMYALVSPFATTYIWTSFFGSLCLIAAWNSYRISTEIKLLASEPVIEDTKPLLATHP